MQSVHQPILAQFIYEISPLIYKFFPIPIMEKSAIENPHIFFFPISLITTNGKIFQSVCNDEKYH